MFCNYLLFTIPSKVAAAIAGIIQQAFSRQISSPRQPNHFRCLLRVTFRLLGCLFMSTFRLVGCFFWVIFRPVGCFFGITLENPDNEPARTEEPTLALENTRIPEERRSRLWSPIIPQERARMEEQTLDNTENPKERRSQLWRTPTMSRRNGGVDLGEPRESYTNGGVDFGEPRESHTNGGAGCSAACSR